MILKVLNCEIGFQGLEKVLNLAKMYIKYEKLLIQLFGYSNFVLLGSFHVK